MPLKVLIVGGGLAGFAAAIAVGRKGHTVEIFEKSKFSNEVGAALHFGPSCARVFRELDIDLEALDYVKCLRWRVFDENGAYMGQRYEMRDRQRELGFSGNEIMCHRVDAHSHLRQLALSYPNTRLHLSSGVQRLDPDTGTIMLQDGTVHQGDLIIGADGIHSKTVQAIAGPSCVAQPSGYNIFRFMVPVNKARADPAVSAFLDTIDNFQTHCDFRCERGPRFVMYTCRGGTLLNFGLLVPGELTKRDPQSMDWTSPSSPEEVLDVYYEFPPFLKTLIKMGEDVKHWAFAARDIPPVYTKGKLVLIGDAAHPMHPTHATGAVQGIEDAACLGELLTPDTTPSELPKRLRMYNALRYERTATLKYASELMSGGDADRLKALKRFLPHASLPEDVDAFIWLYDVIEETQRALRELQRPMERSRL
ncbi:uncharacterized protein K452DRAFT_329390 [Aplosporella prunicola CBS 121167]|uniref:FAD-binding domain-containing protein n=1 Tax=Aplosporella prunicola CBS 121167 TaxID=1176127 RepID=A0A6A6AZ07_9PEZI|nr:uncharacterized protein K452DRAFT_329390 [Aplosporella prunicola CBS 121167]KAF2137172.1 hypothetical protein K452DRAFT_329390 [Aplosporella prunicola CBS 121167]